MWGMVWYWNKQTKKQKTFKLKFKEEDSRFVTKFTTMNGEWRVDGWTDGRRVKKREIGGCVDEKTNDYGSQD